MYPDEQKLHDVELKVGLLQKDVELNDRLCNKLSESIAKIQELNINLMQMIRLHEQRHEHHEKVETDLKDDIKELHSRITTVNREIHERIDQVEKHITERIDAIRSDLTIHKKEDRKSEVSEFFEKWRWFILTMVLVVGFIGGQLKLEQVINLFQ